MPARTVRRHWSVSNVSCVPRGRRRRRLHRGARVMWRSIPSRRTGRQPHAGWSDRRADTESDGRARPGRRRICSALRADRRARAPLRGHVVRILPCGRRQGPSAVRHHALRPNVGRCVRSHARRRWAAAAEPRDSRISGGTCSGRRHGNGAFHSAQRHGTRASRGGGGCDDSRLVRSDRCKWGRYLRTAVAG